MGRLQRILRHLASTRSMARRAFPQATLDALHAAIGAGETRHRAQLRLIIETRLQIADLLDGVTPRGRAHALFSRYRLWDTEENCGVLIYLNLADHSVEIVTDRAVGRAIRRTEWEEACRMMTAGFASGRYHDSALEGIARVNALLETHFPAGDDGGQTNELSDRPIVL